MRVAFVVQGEGRGHMTQAVALYQALEQAGHQVIACLIGVTKEETNIPKLLDEQMDCEKVAFVSPSLIYDKKTNQLHLTRTIANGIRHFGRYFSNVEVLRKTIESARVDIIINFYDVLGGVYNYCVNQNRIPFVSIAHQYFLMHPEFEHPRGQWINRLLVRLNSEVTSAGRATRLALSFTPEADNDRLRLKVVPPLLRTDLHDLADRVTNEGHVLAYCTQLSMIEQLIAIKRSNPMVEIHCFSKREQQDDIELHPSGVIFHKINAKKFLDMMTSCSLLVSTSGFESVCEARYLGKPVIVQPLTNHYEQYCNSIDTERVGAGRRMETLDWSEMSAWIDSYKSDKAYCEWVDQAGDRIISILSDLVTDQRRKRTLIPSKRLIRYTLWPVRRGLAMIY